VAHSCRSAFGAHRVIQSILFFILGFLSAGFLALLVAPSIWRRAVALTRRRMEASVPLSVNEIQADKDRLRAEYAMATRRLEMNLKSQKDKAVAQSLDLDRRRNEIFRLNELGEKRDQTIAGLEMERNSLRAELAGREERIAFLAARLSETEAALEGRVQELERMSRFGDEQSFLASSREIELVAREAEIEKLSQDVSGLRDKRKELERRLRETGAEGKAARDELKLEKRRVADLTGRLEKLMASLSDRDEQLERKERELARLRDAGSVSARSAASTAPKGGAVNGADGKVEQRLTAMMRENKKLRADLAAAARNAPQAVPAEMERENALLRVEISALAAEVVSLAMTLEGPDSAVAKAISRPAPDMPASVNAPQALADRVRALRKAVQPG